MRRYFATVTGLALAAMLFPATALANANVDDDITGLYRLEIPNNPNAVPGFEGWGAINFSRQARGGTYFLASVQTNTPNAAYWLMVNPAPIIDGEAQPPTGDYKIFRLNTDDAGVGYAVGFMELPSGMWEFHGVMTADQELHLNRQYLANTPLCFPGPMGPSAVLPAA